MKRDWVRLGVLLSGLCVLISAQAQENDQESEPAEATTQALPDVVVTAQKVAQTVEQVPASISTLDGEFINQSGAQNFVDLQDYTPNFTNSVAAGGGQMYIRGFGTPDTNPAFDPSVGLVFDGVYYGRSTFLPAFFSDIDRYEVLRGPQGTLFGKNSTAGVLNVVTNAPQSYWFEKLDLVTTDYGEHSIRPVLQIPMTDAAAMRISGNYTHGDKGLLFNTALDRYERNTDQNISRVRVRIMPDSEWSLDLEGFVSDSRRNNNIFQLYNLSPEMLSAIQGYDPQAQSGYHDFRNSENFPSQNRVETGGGSAVFNYDFGPVIGFNDFALSVITSGAQQTLTRRELDADFSPIPFIHDVLAKPADFLQYSNELRVNGVGDDLFGFGYKTSFVAGLFYYDATFRTSDLFAVEDMTAAAVYCNATKDLCGQTSGSPVGGGAPGLGTIGGALGTSGGVVFDPTLGPQSATVLLNQRSRTYSAFGQFEHFFLPEWAVVGGLRIGQERKQGDAHSHSSSQIIKQIANQSDFDKSVDRLETEMSPKLGFKWEPNRAFSVYATWGRGYKSGGFNGLPLSDQYLEFGPERASSWEAGVKNQLLILGGPARITAAVFSTDFNNLQVSTFQGADFVILNAASARSQGMEADMLWLPPLEGLSLRATFGYANAHYVSYPNGPGIADCGKTPSAGQVGPPANCQGPDSQDLSGKPLANAPRVQASFLPAYQFNLVGPVMTMIGVDVLYRGARYLDVDIDPRKYQPATTIFNARIRFSDPSDAYALTLIARNLTNVLVLDQAIGQPLAAGNFAAVRFDRGRTYMANLSVSFGS